MQILVDADACPVIETVEKIAKEHCVPVTLLCDTNHDLIFIILVNGTRIRISIRCSWSVI